MSLGVYYANNYVHELKPVWYQNETRLELNVVPHSVVIKHNGELCVDDGQRFIRNKNRDLIATILYEYGLLTRLDPNAEFEVSYEYAKEKS